MKLENIINNTISEYLNKNNIYFDKPREFVKTINGYDELVLSLKNMSPTEISKTIERWILDNETLMANNILSSNDEVIYCDHAAEAVSQILTDAKINHTIYVGIVKRESHAWVTVGNVVIDPTKDQFTNLKPEDYNQNILYRETYTF